MARPIVVIQAIKMTEAWHQLTKQAQDELFAKVMAHREQVPGVKSVIGCRSLTVPWEWLIVDEYPDIEAIQKLEDLDAELNWRRYWDGVGWLGTPTE